MYKNLKFTYKNGGFLALLKDRCIKGNSVGKEVVISCHAGADTVALSREDALQIVERMLPAKVWDSSNLVPVGQLWIAKMIY